MKPIDNPDPTMGVQYLHYENNKYHYVVDYPRDWILKIRDPDKVDFYPPLTEDIAVICIDVNQNKTLKSRSVEECAAAYIKDISNLWQNMTVKKSSELNAHRWQWIIEYSYLYNKRKMDGVIYLKLVSDTLYQFNCMFERAQAKQGYVLEMLDMANSFKLTK